MPPFSIDLPPRTRGAAFPLPALLLVLAACSGGELIPGNGTRSAPGEDGPYGTHVTRGLITQGALVRPVTVVEPVDLELSNMPLPGRLAGVVLLQGGLVERERYLWLARHLASRGLVVSLPEHAGWLALLDGGVARAALRDLRARLGERLGSVAVGGHSLGGVAAADAALEDAGFSALFLLASQADPATDVGPLRMPVLCIAGTRDESFSESAARGAWERFPRAWLATVDGLTHFSWTDTGRDPTVLRENEAAPGNLAAARHGALWALDAYLEGMLVDATWLGLLAPGASPPSGVRVEAR